MPGNIYGCSAKQGTIFVRLLLFGKIILHLQHCSKLRMAQKITIQKFIALLMLVLFAFSITPKKLLHDVVAGHRDTKCTLDHSHDANGQLTNAGYNCQTDNLVIESPFENSSSLIETFVAVIYAQQNEVSKNNFFSLKHFTVALRGPPAC